MAATIEKFIAPQVQALTLVDNFVRLRGTSGQFPPPIGAMEFQLVGRIVGANTEKLDPPILPISRTNGTGTFLFANECTVGTSPVLRIPADQYRLRISSEIYQPFQIDLGWPDGLADAPPVLLQPGYAYPFPDLSLDSTKFTLLRGNLYQEGGDRQPVAGAVASITAPANNWPFASCITDARGGWVFAIPLGRGDAAFSATVHFANADGTPILDVPGIPIQPGAENSLPQTAFRGSVLTGTDAPISKASVTVDGFPGASTSGASGEWSFYFSLIQPNAQARVTATAPNGRSQSQDVQIQKGVTVPVLPFRIAMN